MKDRPIQQVREEAIDKLIYNYSHSVISAEAFERRLDDVMNTDDPYKIQSLVEDLSLNIDMQYAQEKDTVFTPNYSHEISNEDDTLTSILGNSERGGKWLVPKEIKVYDVLGSTTLDFSEAVFQHQNISINLLCILGSVTVYVPESINIVSRISSVLADVDNRAASVAQKQAPTINISGNVVLGNLTVEKKTTTKEKWVAFANNLKALFGDSKNY
nr:LiaF domain-containing protein [Thalassotalea sp. Y01]